MTLAELNAWERDRFVAELGWIFEGASWVAERAWSRRPFDDPDPGHGVHILLDPCGRFRAQDKNCRRGAPGAACQQNLRLQLGWE